MRRAHAILIFEVDAGSHAYVLRSAPKRDRKPAQDFVKYNEQLANNVIVFWPLGYPARPKPASRALVARCVSG